MTTQHRDNSMLIDDMQLTIDEFARACRRDEEWVRQHVEADLICVSRSSTFSVQFTSADLKRARRLANIEAMFEASEDVAALVVDLIEEVERLKQALNVAKLK